MRIWIAQCLCPSRHTLMASVSANPADGSYETMQRLRAAVRAGLSGGDAKLGAPPMNRWCGLCGATNDTWIFEVGLSKDFDNPEAVLAELGANIEAQVKTRQVLDELGLSYDSKNKKKPN